jgi:hypothetical protein
MDTTATYFFSSLLAVLLWLAYFLGFTRGMGYCVKREEKQREAFSNFAWYGHRPSRRRSVDSRSLIAKRKGNL